MIDRTTWLPMVVMAIRGLVYFILYNNMRTYNIISHKDHFVIQKMDSEESLLTL